ncbi:MAG: hypothetical protein R3F61_04360 [Myxococcota bacterium]
MAPHLRLLLAGVVGAIAACRPVDPLDPLLDAMEPARLATSQREGLPDRFVGLVLQEDRARVVGVGIAVEARDLSVDPELADMLWSPLFSALADEHPDPPALVIARDLGIPAEIADGAARAARDEGFADLRGLGFGDPRLYATFGAARDAAHGVVLVGPDLLAHHADRTLDAIRVEVTRRPDTRDLVLALLTAVVARAPESPAVPWLATAATLGGTPLDGLPVPPLAAEQASSGAARFRQLQRPTGFAADHPELDRALIVERWLEQTLPDDVAVDVRTVLIEQPALLTRLRGTRAVHALWRGTGAPDPTMDGPTSLLGSPGPSSPDAQGPLSARLAWARAPLDREAPALARVSDLSAPPGPSTLGLEASPAHYERMVSVLDGLQAELDDDAHRARVAALADLYRHALADDAPAVVEALEASVWTADVRHPTAVAWSPRDRPTVRIALGVVHRPTAAGLALDLATDTLELERPVSTDDLRDTIDRGPQRSTVRAALTAKTGRSGGCQIAR